MPPSRRPASLADVTILFAAPALHERSARQALVRWRGHWHIENKLHWARDVTFGEDGSTVRVGVGPQVLAALRNLAIGLPQLAGATNIAAACRRYAAQPALALTALGLCWQNE